MQLRGGKGSRAVKIKGLPGVKAALRMYGRRANKGLKAGLYQEGEGIMAESKEQVPVRDGILKGTGHVQLPREEAGRVTVTLGYGGPAAPYALRQHEELSYKHTVGKAKYLSDPADAAVAGMDRRVAAVIERSIEKGGE
jgi:hypothetical protein